MSDELTKQLSSLEDDETVLFRKGYAGSLNFVCRKDQPTERLICERCLSRQQVESAAFDALASEIAMTLETLRRRAAIAPSVPVGDGAVAASESK